MLFYTYLLCFHILSGITIFLRQLINGLVIHFIFLILLIFLIFSVSKGGGTDAQVIYSQLGAQALKLGIPFLVMPAEPGKTFSFLDSCTSVLRLLRYSQFLARSWYRFCYLSILWRTILLFK